MSNGAASAAVVALALHPYAWFLYGAADSDALFLAATVLAFLLLEEDRPVAAGLVGIIATAARPNGIVVLIGLVAVMLDRRGARPEKKSTSSQTARPGARSPTLGSLRLNEGEGVSEAQREPSAPVAVPAVSTGDFMGTGRYLLAAFPVFALMGPLLTNARRAQWAYFGISSVALGLGASVFATGHLLA